MTKQNSKETKAKTKKIPQKPIKLSILFLLFAYGFIVVFTPSMKAFDANGPRFLMLALLNLSTFIFLFTQKEIKCSPDRYYAFFKNGIGIAYTGLMIFSLLSFFKAINVLESVLHFAKIFTVFSSAYLISILIILDKRTIRYLCIAMTLLLIYDSLTVFSDISLFIQRKINRILDIKSIYTNKNILAAAIFVKIPFALGLMAFERKWLRGTGIFGVFLAMTATFFLSTRAFYLGLAGLTFLFIFFFAIRYKQTSDKFQLRLIGIYLSILILAFLSFSITQRFLYPQNEDEYNQSIGTRVLSMAITENSAASLRLEGWKHSWNLFKVNPMFGVGLGNWKIATLKEANQTNQDFILRTKAHNDFIEVATETGIFGGILFISLFVIAATIFLRTFLKNCSSEWLPSLFLPSFGLFCYFFDALFNFPQDRPEIQSFFSIYIGIAIAFNFLQSNETNKPESLIVSDSHLLTTIKSKIIIPLVLACALILIISIGILYQNTISLRIQLLVQSDINNNNFTQSTSQLLKDFPKIPTLNIYGEPIVVGKTRFLLNENRYTEVIELMKKDKSSPFDSRREYIIAIAYENMNNIDSSLIYSQKAYKLKPNFFSNIAILCRLLQQKGLQKEGEDILEKYFEKNTNIKDAWLYAALFYYKPGNIQKAVSVIDKSLIYFPGDIQLLNLKKKIINKDVTIP